MKKTKKQIQSEVDEIVQSLHYEDMDVTDKEKELLYQVKLGMITREQFEIQIDKQITEILES